MDIIIFIGLGWLIPRLLQSLKIKLSPYIGILISLFIVFGSGLFLSYCLLKLAPALETINGTGYPIIPFATVILALISIAYLLFKKQKPIITSQTNASNISAWILLFIAVLSISASSRVFLKSIYTPKVFDSFTSVPSIGVTIFLLGISVMSVVVLFYSRSKDSNTPELHFWISLLIILYGCYKTTLFSLLLTYGLIDKLSISYQTWGSLITLAYLPLTIILCSLAFRKDEVCKSNV